ncbi:unnamed protein product [Linum tenue]|uniref:Uncharacterized protein n=1 Tax=Linum tenue TaxID=586396 RepID=A0AAV0NYR5_9ROSI|nr:unnamed protein product [Linum tenue]
MATLEKQLAPVGTIIDNSAAAKDGNNRKTVGFVRAGVQTQTDGGVKVTKNREDIELPEESDSDGGDEKVEVAQKDVPSEVFGGLVRKRDDSEKDGCEENALANSENRRLGALDRIKRHKRAEWREMDRKPTGLIDFGVVFQWPSRRTCVVAGKVLPYTVAFFFHILSLDQY